MRKHWRYLWYVLRHKWFVYRAGRELGLPRRQLLAHDLSKFSRAEWGPYAQRFFGGVNGGHDTTPVTQARFLAAWQHHYSQNPHHWEHWIVGWGPNAYPKPMPERYVLEMIADWQGAGRAITGQWGVGEWWRKNCRKMNLHPDTRSRVLELLSRDDTV